MAIIYYCPLRHISISQWLRDPKFSFPPSSSLIIPGSHTSWFRSSFLGPRICFSTTFQPWKWINDSNLLLWQVLQQSFPSLFTSVYFPTNLVQHSLWEPDGHAQDLLTPLYLASPAISACLFSRGLCHLDPLLSATPWCQAQTPDHLSWSCHPTPIRGAKERYKTLWAEATTNPCELSEAPQSCLKTVLSSQRWPNRLKI